MHFTCLSNVIIPVYDHADLQYSVVHTGLTLRRCTLGAVGLAYWENPTHIKCISKNYQDISLLVS